MRALRLGFVVVAWTLVAMVCLQVVLAGAALLVRPHFLITHAKFGHVVGVPIFIMVVLGLAGRMPRRFVLLSVGLYLLYGLQYFFVNWPPASLALLRALHAVNALVILAAASYTARSSVAVVHETPLGAS